MPTPVPRTLAQKEAEAHVRPDQVEISAMELSHPSFLDGPIRVHSGNKDLTLTHEDTNSYLYTAVPMRAIYPGQDENRTRPMMIEIENISTRLRKYAKAATGQTQPIEVTVRGYIWPDVSAPAIGPFTVIMATVSMSRSSSKATLQVKRLHDGNFPRVLFTAADFPTIPRG